MERQGEPIVGWKRIWVNREDILHLFPMEPEGAKQEEEFSQMSRYQIVDALIEREQLRVRVKELENKFKSSEEKKQ